MLCPPLFAEAVAPGSAPTATTHAQNLLHSGTKSKVRPKKRGLTRHLGWTRNSNLMSKSVHNEIPRTRAGRRGEKACWLRETRILASGRAWGPEEG